MADPIWPILEGFSHILNFDLHFILNGGTAKILPLQKRNIGAIQKLFMLHLRVDLCCLWSNIADPIWQLIKDSVIRAQFKPLLLTGPFSADYCFGID